MIEKWQKIKEELVYDGYRKIVRRTYKQPDGEMADFDVRSEGEVMCVLALTPDSQVILARQFRVGPGKILNELPGGAADQNESAEEGMARELLEETGYEGEIKKVGASWDDAYSTRYRHHFVATNCQKVTEVQNDETEFTEPVLLSIDEFKKLLASGELSDSETGYRGLEYLKLL